MAARDSPLTQLLQAAPEDPAAADQLVARVYDELCRMAHGLRHDADTLTTRGVVHEAYERLLDVPAGGWNGRGHFFGAAARAMRQVLVDRARARKRLKRGGGVRPLALDDTLQVAAASDESRADDLLALNDALDRLQALDPRAVRVVECRYFAGLTVDETAEALGISAPTVKRDWATARLWLFREVSGMSPGAEE